MSAAEAYEQAQDHAAAAKLQDELVSALDAATSRALTQAMKIPRIEDVMRDAGITPPGKELASPMYEAADVDASVLEAWDSHQIRSRHHLHSLARAWAGDGARLKQFAGAPLPRLWESIQAEIGVPGTRVVDGRISVEPNARMRPALARGRNSLPGEYQELRRVDVQTMRQVNEISALICGATVDPTIPQEMPGLAEVVARADRMIRAALDGQWREDTASFTYCGFAVSELMWETKPDGFVGVHAAKFRDQSIVERWQFDDRGAELVGAEFRGWGADAHASFVLPRGQTPDLARLLLVNIGAVGNDVEGVPPTRPCVSLDKLRQLAMQTWGISYQRFGVPLLKVMLQIVADLLQVVPAFGGMPTKADIQKVVTRLDNMRAKIPAALPMPPGVDIDYMSPMRDMPDPLPFLRYLDELKAMAWGNEGATLGRNNYGSYAMANVADNKYMRAAPFYMSPLIKAYDYLMRMHVLWNFPQADELELFPCYNFRFAGTQDASRWLADARDTIAAQPWTWPEPMRRQAAQLLTLPPECFDTEPAARAAVAGRAEDMGIEQPATRPQAQVGVPAEESMQDTALNGAQVTSMVEVLAQVANGQLPAESAIRILMRAFGMSREDAAAMVTPSVNFAPEPAPEEVTNE